jgi:plasmid replication initiation protein
MKNREPDQPIRDVRLIRKANELVEARYRYDIWETRIFAQVVSMVRYEDADFQEYKIYVSDVIKTFGIDGGGKAYKLLVQGAKGLVNKKLIIERERDGKPTELETWLFTSAEYFKTEKGEGSYLVVTFHPALKPYLLELKNRYLVYDIRNILKLTSSYSIRIYELLKQYEKIGRRSFDVENLKLILGILPGEYKLYGHFKDKVILKAQSDLVAETDISFEFEEQKRGKKVVGLTFFIHSNNSRRHENELPDDAPETATPERTRKKSETLGSPVFEATFAQVSQWGVTETKLRELFVEHGEPAVADGLQCTLDNLSQSKIRENPGGFFVRAVGEGWQSSQQAQKKGAAQRKKQTDTVAEQARESLQKWEQSLEILLENRMTEAREIVRTLTNDDPNLASKAVEGIMDDNFLRLLLERNTSLALEKLSMDDWRAQKPLRDAVIRQIEKMNAEAFRQIQITYDEPIQRARRAIAELKTRTEKTP